VARTPPAAQLERREEVTVNAVMPFSTLLLIWLVLTAGAAIAAAITRLFTAH
jgi:hypothetical protein